jgi:DNA-binding NarL/FixJ family response regulator
LLRKIERKEKVPSSIDEVGLWVIEDDPVFRSGMQELVDSTSGMRCERVFETCEEAIEVLKEQGAPQIVLVDIGLPGMSGIEGIRKMKSLSPATDFIVLTIYESHQKVFDAICAGATGYLVKSLTPEEVVEKVREVIAGGAPMNPHIARQVLAMLSSAAVPSVEYGLTEREKQVLELMVDGLTRKDIAERLFVSPSTILTHSRNIYAKLHVHTRGGAVAKAVRERLV